ncbi:hypothetical protein DYB30_011655 [Aphanomyces astaci]|uniref:HTH CENPB-type domain-containing protein n=1 Tax=Aphanomyces astaci TaxID=112090 RepID=A0A397CYC8_APHAT|nr:hypothetical protein DYB30_011655 [Aphanomyces astaci]
MNFYHLGPRLAGKKRKRDENMLKVATVSGLLRNKLKTAEAWHIRADNKVRSIDRPVALPGVEESVLAWVLKCEELGVCITGELIRKQASATCDQMNVPVSQRPAFSKGWLYKFQVKHGLTSKLQHGEAASMNQRMLAEDRKVLLLVDNAPPHRPDDESLLTNIKVKMLPKNTTAHLQPQDAGIIASFKAKVKQRQLQNALQQIDSVMAGRQDGLYESLEEQNVQLFAELELMHTTVNHLTSENKALWTHVTEKRLAAEVFQNVEVSGMLKLLCHIVGGREPFAVKIDANELMTDLKTQIKEQNPSLRSCNAMDIQLYQSLKDATWLSAEDLDQVTSDGVMDAYLATIREMKPTDNLAYYFGPNPPPLPKHAIANFVPNEEAPAFWSPADQANANGIFLKKAFDACITPFFNAALANCDMVFVNSEHVA